MNVGYLLLALAAACTLISNRYYRRIGVGIRMKLPEIEAALRKDKRPRGLAVSLSLASLVLYVAGFYLLWH
jgi:hypothetical protein